MYCHVLFMNHSVQLLQHNEVFRHQTHSVVEGNSVDGHEVTEMVLVRDVVAVPSDNIKRRVILHRTHEAL